MSGEGELHIDIDRAGRGSLNLGGKDLSNYVNRFEIIGQAGQSPQVTIHLNPIKLNFHGDPAVVDFIKHQLDIEEKS